MMICRGSLVMGGEKQGELMKKVRGVGRLEMKYLIKIVVLPI